MALSPIHTIHRYTDQTYKVVTFKRQQDSDFLPDRHPPEQVNDDKLNSNFSRARSMVLQYALCNPWDWFFTGTLDPEKWDRSNIDDFMSDFSQHIRDWRKKYDSFLSVLLVPERHEDGKWHVHGLIRGLPYWETCGFYFLPLGDLTPYPYSLSRGGFRCWMDFHDRYGYCSLAPIKDPVACAKYITKYITKDLGGRAGDLGKHLYFHSRPLKKAERISDIYIHYSELEAISDYDCKFCKTGMVEADWTFPMMFESSQEVPLFSVEPSPVVVDPGFDPASIDPWYEQLRIPLG